MTARTTGNDSRRVLVTDAGRGSAIAVIRSLGRRGWYVVAADSDARSPGFHSRYTRRRVLYPPPMSDPDGVAEVLLAAAVRERVDLIIPVTDEIILPMAAMRDRFAAVSTVALPSQECLEVAWDKAATLELAARHGVPIPRSRLVATRRDALDAGRELGWPVVVKPTRSRSYRPGRWIEKRSVTYARDASDLLDVFVAHGEERTLIQEYADGQGHGVELLLAHGDPIAAFQHRRLHEVPVTGGASAFRESVAIDPVLYRYAVSMLRSLRWNGLAMVEFRVGPDGPRLMEVNGRIWGSLPLAVQSGVDFPALLAEMHLANGAARTVIEIPYRLGTRSRNLPLELAWIASVLSGRRRYPYLPTPARTEAVRAMIRLVDTRDGWDVLSLEDPLPGLAELEQAVEGLARRAVSRQVSHPRSRGTKQSENQKMDRC